MGCTYIQPCARLVNSWDQCNTCSEVRELGELKMSMYMREKLQGEVWKAWAQGLSIAHIARVLPTRHISVHTLIGEKGGIRPAPRRRSKRALSALEREQVAPGPAAGCSLRAISAHLSRAPSTISREVKRNLGARSYSGLYADRRKVNAKSLHNNVYSPCSRVTSSSLTEGTTCDLKPLPRLAPSLPITDPGDHVQPLA